MHDKLTVEVHFIHAELAYAQEGGYLGTAVADILREAMYRASMEQFEAKLRDANGAVVGTMKLGRTNKRPE